MHFGPQEDSLLCFNQPKRQMSAVCQSGGHFSDCSGSQEDTYVPVRLQKGHFGVCLWHPRKHFKVWMHPLPTPLHTTVYYQHTLSLLSCFYLFQVGIHKKKPQQKKKKEKEQIKKSDSQTMKSLKWTDRGNRCYSLEHKRFLLSVNEFSHPLIFTPLCPRNLCLKQTPQPPPVCALIFFTLLFISGETHSGGGGGILFKTLKIRHQLSDSQRKMKRMKSLPEVWR